MEHAFLRKLRHGAALSHEDLPFLHGLAMSVRHAQPRDDIIAEGDEPKWLPLILEGWAYRYKILDNGKRQIVSLLIAGDLCEPFGTLSQFVDASLAALTPVTFAKLPLQTLVVAARSNPRLEHALWWDLSITTSIERERIVSLGRRDAKERMAHFLCEMHQRLSLVGLADGTRFELPVTQNDLADILGMSTVHVNRSLQDLRASGLLVWKGRHVNIQNVRALRDVALFDTRYLHVHTGDAPTDHKRGTQ